jgi:hypothetical protein
MKPLDELKTQRPQILLAEIAGLLHNIGKLDPNFLASVLSESDSDDKKKAQQEIEQSLQLIDPYSFKRFTSPDLTLIAENVRKILKSKKWAAKKDMAAALKGQFSEPADLLGVDELVQNWDDAEKKHPKTARLLDAIWQFYSWYNGNGPLYFCTPCERLRINQIRDESDSIQNDVQKIVDALKTAPQEQKKELGLEKQKLEGERDKKREELTAVSQRVYDSERARQQITERKFRVKLSIAGETWSLDHLLCLFWDTPFFYKPGGTDDLRQSALQKWLAAGRGTGLLTLLALSHGEVSGAEKTGETIPPKWNAIRASTAFGYEPHSLEKWLLQEHRRQLLNLSLSACSTLSELPKKRTEFLAKARPKLQSGLGDTQWPINEITLWDYAGSIATLFKSAVAKAVLEDRLPTVAEVKWRLLSIRYDGLEYLSQAHHISDLLARRDTLEAALDAVKAVIEVEYPLGNEIYRDENGSVLLVPDVRDGEQRVELLTHEENKLGELLLERFSEASYGDEKDDRSPLGGEIKPIIALSDERLGKQIKLTETPGWSHPALQTAPEKVQAWWKDSRKHGEICTVCRLRPQGFGAPDDRHPKNNHKGWNLHLAEEHHRNKQPLDCEVCKAIDRQVCWVCLERRDDRSKKWANNVNGSLKRTIWTDEVADENGRLALVVGRFGLDGWLNGTLIPTMQKSASFARIQRCWRTTQEFWQQVENKLPELVGEDQGKRLRIVPSDASRIRLGPYHVYDLELKNRFLSVVWTGSEFITADNLEYFSRIAELGKKPDWKVMLEGQTYSIHEPSAYLSNRKKKTQFTIKEASTHDEHYSPFIRILAQPSLFMALVPANKAMEVAKHIKCKYETEMGKVRDRLPLHLGLVFAPRRTPVRALLEAGQRMLEMPDVWQQWEVESVSHGPQFHHVRFRDNGVSWHIPAVMGDNATPDQWYPHLMLREPGRGEDLTAATSLPWKHANDLQVGDKVFVRPSRFDFEFLDTTGRRFELNYDAQSGVRIAPVNRLHPVTRPLLLEEFADLETVWSALKKLPGGQRDFLVRLIETKRTEWKVDTANDATLRHFACDTLQQAGDGWWRNLDDEQRRLLKDWGTNGKLADAVELYAKMMKLEIE